MALLARWAFCTPGRGGLQGDAPAAALSLLTAFLGAAACHSYTVPVALTKSGDCHWPGPVPVADGIQVIAIEVSSGGFDATPLFAAAGSISSSVFVNRMAGELKSLFPLCLSEPVPLLQFFGEAKTSQHLFGFGMQLVWAGCNALEKKMSASAQDGDFTATWRAAL